MRKPKDIKEVNEKRGGRTVKELLIELKKERENLLQIKKELTKKDTIIENLKKKNKDLKLGEKPKYIRQGCNLTLTEEIIDDIGLVVRNGMFKCSEIAGFLGLNYATLYGWLKDAESGKLPEDDLRCQLSKVIEYSKHIFYLSNQQVINRSALAGDTKEAKWNLESRFKYLRTNSTEVNNSVSIGNPEILSKEEQDKLKRVREVSIIIQQSINGDVDND